MAISILVIIITLNNPTSLVKHLDQDDKVDKMRNYCATALLLKSDLWPIYARD